MLTIALGGYNPLQMLCRTSLGRSAPMLMLSRASLGGRCSMLVFCALRRCSLMVTGFASFFRQVRRDGLDSQGLDPRHRDWRCGWRKGTGRVVAADHNDIIPC
jgi:hypothetical protein